ncbi:MAG TPA: aminotransferase class V-fold PLP-dependent enzyme [Candidatus Competibacteraceae bacterium]|nr:aminotransferase class V-fold PLP-dependent enzyme [Candidatus Competibacteraceae bacterium]HRZ06917.1 aminotransferase class V-fold PLP-dependent enzyme [Candidatus Competibacteraceae bacterium]HSA46547.1 aminotransferase class V-fold PLP-dependent enzyme [Candidatus Competibacteraceae bacterium]
MRSPIYLDYAATTPVDPQVAARLGRHLTLAGVFGNPASTTHYFGRQAAQAVETARAEVAALINADPGDLLWTSGATEANNLALFGVMRANARKGRHLLTAKTEHKAILDICRRLERDGGTVTYLDPDPDGRIPLARIAAALRPDTVLASLMHVNNETGVIQDLAAIGALTRERGVLLHVDAAQSAGKLPIDLQTWPVDLLSLSAHKLYGPKGVGALYVRQRPVRVRLEPLLYGGGQERGLRAGTLPTHQIVAMGEAFRIAREQMAVEPARIAELRDRLWRALATLGEVTRNGHAEQCVAGILNVSFASITAEALLADVPNIAVSTGSACTSAGNEPSHVLRAMGCDAVRARGAVRFSLGRFTTVEEIDQAVQAISAAVQRLRELSPLWPSSH